MGMLEKKNSYLRHNEKQLKNSVFTVPEPEFARARVLLSLLPTVFSSLSPNFRTNRNKSL